MDETTNIPRHCCNVDCKSAPRWQITPVAGPGGSRPDPYETWDACDAHAVEFLSEDGVCEVQPIREAGQAMEASHG